MFCSAPNILPSVSGCSLIRDFLSKSHLAFKAQPFLGAPPQAGIDASSVLPQQSVLISINSTHSASWGFPCDLAGKESTCSVGDLGSILGLGRSPGERKGYPLQYSGLENSMNCIALVSLTEKAMAPHSSTPAWKIPWVEEAGRLQSMGSLRVGHNRATSLSLFTFMHWRRKWQPTPVFLPGESQGQGSLVGYRLWGHTESDMTEVT